MTKDEWAEILGDMKSVTVQHIDDQDNPGATYVSMILPLHFVTETTDAEVSLKESKKPQPKGAKQSRITHTVIPSQKWAKMVMGIDTNCQPIGLVFHDAGVFKHACSSADNAIKIGEPFLTCPFRYSFSLVLWPVYVIQKKPSAKKKRSIANCVSSIMHAIHTYIGAVHRKLAVHFPL